MQWCCCVVKTKVKIQTDAATAPLQGISGECRQNCLLSAWDSSQRHRGCVQFSKHTLTTQTSEQLQRDSFDPCHIYRFPVIILQFGFLLKCRLRWKKQTFHIPLRKKITMYTDNSKEHSTFIQCKKNCKYYVATTILLKPTTITIVERSTQRK